MPKYSFYIMFRYKIIINIILLFYILYNNIIISILYYCTQMSMF